VRSCTTVQTATAALPQGSSVPYRFDPRIAGSLLVSNVSRDNNWRRFRIPSTVLKQRGVLWQIVEHQSLLVTERLT
jgi:hypothetical protein